MRERIRRALELITSDPARESGWLHTLSLLEFIGARKIGRTAAAHHPHLSVLEHWADETRHAAAFESLATEVGGGRPGAYLCADEAKRYFQALDEALDGWVRARHGEAPVLNYLLVTAVIERRAMALYPLLRAASRHPRVREELSQIIVEEQSHRVAIEERCRKLLGGGDLPLSADALLEPMALEEKLFETFWSAVEHTLMPADAAHPG